MGTILNAFCPTCGFRYDTIYFGSGFFQKDPKVPALDKFSDAFVPEAILGNPDLKYYSEPGMHKGIPDEFPIVNFDIILSSKANECPECREFSMVFEDVGNWD